MNKKIIVENPIKHMYKVKSQEFGDVGFKFGMNTWYLFSHESGIGLMDLQEKLQKADLGVMLDLFYAASQSYCIKKKQDFTMTKYDFGDVIDEIGFETAGELLTQGMMSFGSNDIKKKTQTQLKQKL